MYIFLLFSISSYGCVLIINSVGVIWNYLLFEAVGHTVLKLKRERIAFLTLDGLASKDYRRLTIKEVKQLYSLDKK